MNVLLIIIGTALVLGTVALEARRKTSSRDKLRVWGVGALVIVVGASLALIFSPLGSEAKAAPVPVVSAPTSVEDKPTASQKCADSCPAKVKKRIKRFKQGKYGNSKGVKLPKKFRKAMEKAKKKQAAKAGVAYKAGSDDWWDDPLGLNWCWAGVAQHVACYLDRPDIAEDVTKVSAVCGLTGLLAFIPGVGWGAVGRGASECLIVAWAAKSW